MSGITNWYKNLKPVNQLLLIGFIFRFIATIFSKGFGFSDDHFLIVEPAQNWADGFDNFWLPSPDDPARAPQGHPLLYVWINYFILKCLMFFGINDPQMKMLFIRFLHAMWSLLIIKYGYKIILHYTNQKTAWLGGLALAVLWLFPFVSVRNLAEFVCLPPLFIATWLLIKEDKKYRDYIFAGLLLGLAFSIRFQSVLFSAGFAIAVLVTKVKFKYIFAILISFLTFITLTQGVTDYFVWKKPFGEFLSYVEYNVNNANNYGNDVWYMYFALILGLLIPPLSFAFFGGWFYIWKKYPFLFWPAFLYLAFHSYFPNKQERFILTILPSIIVAGVVGIHHYIQNKKVNLNSRFIKFSKYFVIILNTILLCVLSVSYSKRHRCEAMTYLYEKGDCVNFLIEDSNKENDFLIPPLFYFGKWPSVFGISKTINADSALSYCKKHSSKTRPNYVVFWQAENIKARVDSMKKRFPTLIYEATIDPSLIDKTLYFLNPLNDNQTAYIYKIK